MSQRFHIEDLIEQDSRGVLFQALDTESGNQVALRRFFPFGAEGGGLEYEEQIAYSVAIARLANLRHPGLRGVITGGCDPVDGMPFIASEWIEGTPLLPVLQRGPLQASEAVIVLTQALETSLLLSEVLADEAVWVETDLNSIILGDEKSGRGFTFWISPTKWLCSETEPRGLEAIVTLTEELMHWQGKVVGDQAGQGLGGWLKWLRAAAPTTHLHEAMEMLAASTGGDPPMPAAVLVATATRPLKVKQKSSNAPWIAVAALGIAVTGLAIWKMKVTPSAMESPLASSSLAPALPAQMDLPAPPPEPAATRQPRPRVVANPPAPVDPAQRASEMAARMSEELARRNAAQADRQQELANDDAIHLVTDGGVLLEKKGRVAVLEGNLAIARFSGDGKGPTLYLEFSDPAPHEEPRGFIMRRDMQPDMAPQALAPLIGKRVRIRGTVETETISSHGKRHTRPRLRLDGRQSIELAE